MRLVKYLTEGTPFEESIKIVEMKCQPFLKDFKKFPYLNFLWSGRHETGNIIVKKIRKNRRPLNTNKEVHYLLDSMFQKKFKLKPRSNALFTIANEDDAREYSDGMGDAYAIFPMGNYKIIWSPKVGDLYTELQKRQTQFQYLHGKDGKSEQAKKEIQRIIDTYKVGDLKGAIHSENEVMVMADQFIGLKFETYIQELEEYFD